MRYRDLEIIVKALNESVKLAEDKRDRMLDALKAINDDQGASLAEIELAREDYTIFASHLTDLKHAYDELMSHDWR